MIRFTSAEVQSLLKLKDNLDAALNKFGDNHEQNKISSFLLDVLFLVFSKFKLYSPFISSFSTLKLMMKTEEFQMLFDLIKLLLDDESVATLVQDCPSQPLNISCSDNQGGIKYFTSWEPILSAKNFARNSGSQTRQKIPKQR